MGNCTSKKRSSSYTLGHITSVLDERAPPHIDDVADIFAEKERFVRMPLKEKRQLYRCTPEEVWTLADIPPWGARGTSNPNFRCPADEEAFRACFRYNASLNDKISLLWADISTLEVDAVVNAANTTLSDGAGVSGALHHGAGPLMAKECALLRDCEEGGVRVTSGYRLPARHVIHAVGPQGLKPDVLSICYLKCLEAVTLYRIRTVAFPCISTGIFGYPLEDATNVALQAVRTWMEENDYLMKMDRIIFCVYDEEALMVYKRLLGLYFPVLYPDMANRDNTGVVQAGADRAGVNQAGVERTRAYQAAADRGDMDRAGAERAGVAQAGANRAGADQAGVAQAGADRAGADQAGADRAGADRGDVDRAGAERAGVAQAGADRAGADQAGADRAGADQAGAGAVHANLVHTFVIHPGKKTPRRPLPGPNSGEERPSVRTLPWKMVEQWLHRDRSQRPSNLPGRSQRSQMS